MDLDFSTGFREDGKFITKESVEEYFNKVKEDVAGVKGVNNTSKTKFFEHRKDYLKERTTELEAEVEQLQQEMEEEIQQIIAEKGAKIISLTQMLKIMNEQLGAAELLAHELKEEKESAGANS